MKSKLHEIVLTNGYLPRILLSKEESRYAKKDLIQDGMVFILEKARTYDGTRASFYTYAKEPTRKELKRRKRFYKFPFSLPRKSKSKPKRIPLDSVYENLSEEKSNSPENLAIERERKEILEKAYLVLTPVEKNIFRLLYSPQSPTHREIAQVLNVHESRITQAIALAIPKLRRFFENRKELTDSLFS